MSLNWLETAVLALLLICMILGFRKGLLKQGLILLGALILLWLMSFLLPYTKQALTEYTPVEELVSGRVDKLMAEQLELPEEVKAKIEFVGGDDAAGDAKSAEALKAAEKAGVPGVKLTRKQQTDLIENSRLPGFLKEILLENNNSEIYNRLGVDSFAGYMKAYLTELIINVLAYVTSFLLAFIIYRLILAAAHLVDHLPLARALNHGFGGILGLLQGLVILGLFFAALVLVCRTQFGRACYACIEESRYLTFLYEYNPIMAIVTAVTG
ncbi:MAG: CvpA family protein [Lachnospiraceae bacterium]|nr:CvpA family protein [Lachnospiraceae bacterium]